MTESEQTQRFCDELDKLVDRYRCEYDLTYAAIVGCLHMKAILLCMEATEGENE